MIIATIHQLLHLFRNSGTSITQWSCAHLQPQARQLQHTAAPLSSSNAVALSRRPFPASITQCNQAVVVPVFFDTSVDHLDCLYVRITPTGMLEDYKWNFSKPQN
jgi:hypothetical protein